MHAIERELIRVTEYKVQRKFTDRQDYLKSIFNAANKMSDDSFNDISEEAYHWLNSCVQALNTSRNADLPDFDEAELPEVPDDPPPEPSPPDTPPDEPEDEEPDAEDEAEEDEPDSDTEADEEPEIEEAEEEVVKAKEEPKKRKKAEKHKVPPKPKKQPPPDPVPPELEDDTILDKWGCIVGSKNSTVLAMFEKGATTKEVKDAMGGTYYNLLNKMRQRGHRIEKDGALVKLTHKADLVSSRKSKK